MSSAKRLAARAFGIAVLAVVGYLLVPIIVSVVVQPRVVVNLQGNGNSDFHVDLRKNFRVNSVSSVELRVDSGRSCIWKHDFDAQAGLAAQHTLLLPKRRPGDNIMSQMVGAGEQFDVVVTYQYDVFMSPCGGTTIVHFALTNDGKLICLGEE